jgi:hypothetical protein
MASFAAGSRLLKSQLRDSGQALLTLLDESRIDALAAPLLCPRRRCFWRPAIVILTFLRQVLWPHCSCRAAVAQTLSDPGIGNPRSRRPRCDPSAYSQARQRLPRALLGHLSDALVTQLDEPQRRWHGHRVRVIDGSCISTPDTPALQAAYPQSSSQQKGCGFPLIRLVGLFCWASGALLELRYAAQAVGELQLFRRLLAHFQPGDVAVADRLYGTYCELALLQQHQAHGLFRLHNARRADLRQGQRLGAHDRLMVWTRPPGRPLGMPANLWATIPETLTVRRLRRVVLDRQGFRQRRLDLVTTLVDARAYPADELAQLYRDRWRVELSLRSLKCTQGMDRLRCQSPAMVHKELIMHQIAYNLIRLLMRTAGMLHGVDPHRLSFAGTGQRVQALLPYLRPCCSGRPFETLLRMLLQDIAADPIPNRPGRKEPRAVKRRNKEYPYLTCPRARARHLPCYDGGG